VAAGTFAGLTSIWNIDGSLRSSLPSPHGPIFNIKFNPSGSLFVTCSASGVFEIYETKDWISIFKVPGTGRVWEAPATIPCLAWLDDTRLAILGPDAPNAIVNCWQFDETRAISPFLQLIGHEGPINDIQFDKQTRFIATASDDHSVRLWKSDKSSPYHEFRNHNGEVRAVAFQPQPEDIQPRILASSSFDGKICLYDISNLTLLYSIGNQLHSFPDDRIQCISWSPDGKYLCSGDLESVVGIWEWRDSLSPRPFAIWAPERIREDQQEQLPNGTNGHKEDVLDRPVYRIHWQKNGQSFVVCRENRRVYTLVLWANVRWL
jgi:WD40 repeat protein